MLDANQTKQIKDIIMIHVKMDPWVEQRGETYIL